jgi:hypothetical protein
MRDTMVPGYMYAEQFVLEANGFTSNNDQNQGKVATKTAGNFVKNMINWLRDKLATFLPKYFETSLQKQCEWFNKNGEAKYNEIKKAAESGQYNFPNKDKYYKYNVTFDPSAVDPQKIIDEYKSKPSLDENQIDEFKTKLISVFPKSSDLAGNIVKESKGKSKDETAKIIENAILFSQTAPIPPEENKPIDVPKWNEIFETMKFMCTPGQDGKARGGKWATDVTNFSNSLQKAVAALQSEIKTESFEIKLNKDSFFQERDEPPVENPQPAEGDTSVNKGSDVDTSKTEETPKKEGEQQAANNTSKQLLDAIQEIASAFYVTSLNTIVKTLFTETYNNFKGVIDDYDTMKKGGTDAKTQQTNNNATPADNTNKEV